MNAGLCCDQCVWKGFLVAWVVRNMFDFRNYMATFCRHIFNVSSSILRCWMIYPTLSNNIFGKLYGGNCTHKIESEIIVEERKSFERGLR